MAAGLPRRGLHLLRPQEVCKGRICFVTHGTHGTDSDDKEEEDKTTSDGSDE